MIGPVLARELQQGVEDFLRTTFPISTPQMHGVLDRLLDEDGSVFKGPYVSLKLPFRLSETDSEPFEHVSLGFRPYRHQEEAFERIRGQDPKSTVIATGTGSGKTECYLMPILEHCYRHRGEEGIKAILVYPMNALANDQAGRIARTIWESEGLRGEVRAGLYIGQRDRAPRQVMERDKVVTDRHAMRLEPPDILLTNYKMLDYLLIRPEDLGLWQQNGAETLRYLVVDELHTFDGAQGTDLACLLRRLKARLGTPEGHLCCVGTSATLGGSDARREVAEYARSIFGEPFGPRTVITEDRLTATEFLDETLVRSLDPVPPERVDELEPTNYARSDDYLQAQGRLWFGEEAPAGEVEDSEWAVDLGERLKEHPVFRNLLAVMREGVRSLPEIETALARVTPELKEGDAAYRRALLDSLLALVGAARARAPSRPGDEVEEEGAEHVTLPLVDLRVQLWLRELRRMVASVESDPELTFFDDLTEEQQKRHLPVIHCRDCGSSGWGAVRRQEDLSLQTDLRAFYQAFFGWSPDTTFLFPEDRETAASMDGTWLHLDRSFHLQSSMPEEGGVAVFIPDTVRQGSNNRRYGHHDCPYCGSRDSLTILGSRAASLTSVLITQLFASGYNDHKKLLTFSDSVQDASHRAGFYAGRTYRFNVRAAIQQCVDTLGEGQTLKSFPAVFSEHWEEELSRHAFIGTFLAPDMAWLRDYEHLVQHERLPRDSDLQDLVRRRISWEIYSEYGYRSRIGRSLEKSGVSILRPDPERLDAATVRLQVVLRNELGGFGALEEESVRSFLVGLLAHLRTQGAVFHDAADEYVRSGGKSFLLSHRGVNKLFMPRLGPKSRRPMFLTSRTGKNFTGLHGRHRTWYEAWAEKCFTPVNPMVSSVLRALYGHVLDVLLDENLLDEVRAGNDPVWGIPQDALQISGDVRQFRCGACGHSTSGSAGEATVWVGAPCLRFRCNGRYARTDEGLDYYGRLYQIGDVRRIVTHEHTSLLDREVREDVEARFQDQEHPWDPNLLSCTPTLEMGIDIGDLSTIILESIPPAESNYLQRIGRAGRRDGNALNLAVANGRPHDLYFYAQPEEMIEGEILPPGVFLAAAAVLERQFTAFCFDRWVETDLPDGAIPSRLRTVLDEVDHPERGQFPHNFLAFVSDRREGLFESFLNLFLEPLEESAEAHIRRFAGLEGVGEGTLDYKLVDGLHAHRQEREGLTKNIRRLRRRIRSMQDQEIRDQNFDQELDELKQERSALERVIREKIDKRHTLNFLTDEGLLPNYAFPEAGVTLRSIIYRKRGEGEEREFDTRIYEYERPAVSAISELAPMNRFYAEGRNVQIDRVDLSVTDIERWRFCDNCSHSRRKVDENVEPECPRCGSAQWADGGQEQPMVRMRQVFASSSERESRTTDDSDERRPLFYNKQLLVDFDPQDVTSAFLIDDEDLPFGFEFLSRVSLREVNFGEKLVEGTPLRIAGVEAPRPGFEICRKCGKVQRPPRNTGHTISCPARKADDDANFIRCLYLYREFRSEGIRILLPETTFTGSDRTLHSFVAALQLGLQKHFEGKTEHLQVASFEEPIPDTPHRKRSLVLYDTVPGGTGYLKELMRSREPLLDVFRSALETIRACRCNSDPEKDGCYRCLYAYRNSYDMAETSRDRAAELLSKVLDREERFQEAESLRDLPVNALFDSELEARFVDLLRRSGTDERPISVTPQIVGSKPGYLLEIGDESYYIEPQVELAAKQGVDIPSRADFLITPARSSATLRPVAVFIDGWAYHRDRVGLDLAQRMAIARSGQFHVWSLTWDDIEKAGGECDHCVNLLAPDLPVPGAVRYFQMLKGLDSEHGVSALERLPRQGSFDWLARFLATPNPDIWRSYASLQVLLYLDRTLSTSSEAQREWRVELGQHVPPHVTDFVTDLEPEVFGHYEAAEELEAFMAGTQDGARELEPDALRLVIVLDDLDMAGGDPDAGRLKPLWNGLLRLYNLLHFLPGALVLGRSAIEDGTYQDLAFAPPSRDGGSADAAWNAALEDALPEMRPIVEAAIDRDGWNPPDVGFELVGSDGRVQGMAELAWPGRKWAVVFDDDAVSAAAFEAEGWTVKRVSSDPDDPAGVFE